MRLHYPLTLNGAEDAGQLPWKDGVPSTGVEGSYFGHALFTDTEAEILAAIDGGGFNRNGSDLTQLLQTIARGLWLGPFGGTSTALTATLPNNLVIPSLQVGVRVRGIAASNYPGGGGTLAITGVGTAAGIMSCPILGPDGTTVLAAGAWKAGQFLSFDIDVSGNARFGGVGSGSGSAANLRLHREFLDTAGSQTWNPPQGLIGLVCAELWGAGGGGAGTNGSGGGAGEWAYTEFAATYGTPVPYINGLPSSGVTSGNANNGGTTSIAGCTAVGGYGGGASSANPGVGGSGGTGGLKRRAGGAGQDLDGNETYAAGGTAAKMPGPHYGLSASNTGEGGYATSSGAAVGALGSNGGPAGIELTYLLLAA